MQTFIQALHEQVVEMIWYLEDKGRFEDARNVLVGFLNFRERAIGFNSKMDFLELQINKLRNQLELIDNHVNNYYSQDGKN